jgi:hypothetical protein
VSSPGPDDTTRRLTTAAAATGADRPQLAFALANSDLNDSEIHAVGGFARAMQLATTANLAHDSGARTDFSADELNHVQGVGGQANQDQQADSRSWLTQVVDGFGTAISNTGSWLFDNAFTHALGTGLDQFANLVHMPFRLLSDQVDPRNNREIDREMQADGYDPNSTTSYLAFLWSQGENTYHDLSDIRDTYTDDLVDQIIQFQRDPEQWSEDLSKLAPAEQKKLIDLSNSPDWVKAADLIDRQHISPGRDFAQIITLGNTDNALFTAISGTLDAAYTWFADPTLILGKANRVIKTFDVLGRDIESASGFGAAARRTAAAIPYLANKRAGLQGTIDQAGVEALLRVDPSTGKAVTKVGKAWQNYLEDAGKLRAANDRFLDTSLSFEERLAASADRAGIMRGMDRRYGPLMGLLDEINGTRVVIGKRFSGELPADFFHQVAEGKYDGIDDAVRTRLRDAITEEDAAGLAVKPGAERTGPTIAADAEEMRFAAISGVLNNELAAGRKVYYRDLNTGSDWREIKHPADVTRLSSRIYSDPYLAEPASYRLGVPDQVGVTSVRGAGGNITFPDRAHPITELGELASYLSSTAGMLRMGGGEAARRAVVMPGRLSFWAEHKAVEATHAAKTARSRAMIFDYTNALKMLPHESEAAILDRVAADAGDLQLSQMQRSALTSARAARLKWDRVNRRLTTTLPSVKRIDLTDGGSTKMVEQIARIYLNKGEAARLASAYSLGNLAQRRQIVKGVIMQSFHASGLSRSEDGTLMMEKFLGDFEEFGRQRYGLGDTDLIIDPITGAERRAALLPSQVASTVVIPSMREMNYLATKLAASGFTRRTGLSSLHKIGQSPAADHLMGAIKLGWITTVAGGLRNALDEVANFAAYGMGRDVLAARAVFTRATKDIRAKRRELSREYQAEVKARGGARSAVDADYARRIAQAGVSHEEAQAAVEQSRKYAGLLEEAEHLPARRVTDARERWIRAQQSRRQAELAVKSMPTDGAFDSAGQRQLQDAVEAATREEERALGAYNTRMEEQRKIRPGEMTARVQSQIDRRGVLSIPDAEAQLVRAEAELKTARALEGVIRWKVPLLARGVADTVNDLMIGVGLGKLIRVFGKAYKITDEHIGYAAELVDRELHQVIERGVFQNHYWDSGIDDPLAMSLHRAGLKARQYAYEKRYEGYGEIETDGGAGLDGWAQMMQLAFEDANSPAHAFVETMRTMRRTESNAVSTGPLTDHVWDELLGGERTGVSDETLRELDRAMEYNDEASALAADSADDPDILGTVRPDGSVGDHPQQEAGRAYEAMLNAQRVAMNQHLDAQLDAGKQVRYTSAYLPGEDGRLPTGAVGNSRTFSSKEELSDFLDEITNWRGPDHTTPYSDLAKPSAWEVLGPGPGDRGLIYGHNKPESVIPGLTLDESVFDNPGEDFVAKEDEFFRKAADGSIEGVSNETADTLQRLWDSEPTSQHINDLREAAKGRYDQAKAEQQRISQQLDDALGTPSSSSVANRRRPKKEVDPDEVDRLEQQMVQADDALAAAEDDWNRYKNTDQNVLRDWHNEMDAARAKAMREHLAARIAKGDRVRYVKGWGGDGEARVHGFALNESDLDRIDSHSLAFPVESGISLERGITGKEEKRYLLDSAKAAIRARMDDPELRSFVDHAEVFQQVRSGERVGSSEALRSQALDEYADRLTAHLAQALGNRSGDINPELLDVLADSKSTGFVPDASWLSRIPKEQRPPKAIGQLWAPYNPAHELGQMPRGYTQMMAVAYDKIVSDQINALSRNPLVTALYINARKNSEDYYKHLRSTGFDKHSATEIVKFMSIRQAEVEALKHIDNPYVQSQASLVVRNYATFIRAQEDWLRRWGRTLKDNPQIIRQAQLLIHGGESAGHVEVNEDGDLTFTYPGGALMSGVIDKVFGANGVTPGVTVPIASELSSKLTYANPSLDNPVGITATPLLSIPFDLIADWTLGPDQALLRASLDKAVNGELGAGRSWYEKIIPSWASRIWQAFAPADDPGSAYAQAWGEALAQIEASGKLDDPYYQTSTGQADLRHQITVATRNNLVWKALFGIFAPAAPQLTIGAEGSLPHDDGPYGSGVKADWIYHQQGLANLREEARMMMSKYGYEQARAMWTAQHPGELIYFDSARTEVNTPSATAPASIIAAKFLEDSPKLFAKYGGPGGVAAYLIPQGRFGTKNGEFSDVAYQSQLEAGIRQYRSLNDYFTAIITSRGARDYYAAKTEYDRQHEAAIRAGNQSQADEIDQQWAAAKAKILQNNPLLPQRFSDYAADSAGKQLALEQIHELATDPDPEITKSLGRNRAGLVGLLDAYSAYQQGVAKLEGRRSRQATREKQLLKSAYESQVIRLAGGPDPDTGVDDSLYPELADMARGVFRLPE